jgi:hypothetical protein
MGYNRASNPPPVPCASAGWGRTATLAGMGLRLPHPQVTFLGSASVPAKCTLIVSPPLTCAHDAHRNGALSA